MKAQRLSLEAKFPKSASYLRRNCNATWMHRSEFSGFSPELFVGLRAIPVMTMVLLPKTGKPLQILAWLLAHLLPILMLLFLMVRCFLDFLLK